MIARSAGVGVAEMYADPAIALTGVQNLAQTLVPDDTLQREGQLITTKLAKLGDAWEMGLERIARTGGYERAAQMLEQFRTDALRYLDSADFERQADQI